MNQMAAVVPATGFRARFTTAEFLRMCEAGAFDDIKVELIDGELERMPPPQNEHGRRQASVVIRLARVAEEALLRGEVGIDLGDDTVVGCDAAILRAPVAGNRILQADEVTLAVEVAETTLARDMGMKRIKYASAGIAHYWVIDGERSVVHVWGEPMGGDYAQIATVRFGEPLAVPGTDATIVID